MMTSTVTARRKGDPRYYVEGITTAWKPFQSLVRPVSLNDGLEGKAPTTLTHATPTIRREMTNFIPRGDHSTGSAGVGKLVIRSRGQLAHHH